MLAPEKRLTNAICFGQDLILVMEYKHKQAIAKQYRHLDLPDIIVLDIPDEYQYMSAELVEMIQTSTEAVLNDYLN